jgi:transcriptional regulator with XRE-family HTH domain
VNYVSQTRTQHYLLALNNILCCLNAPQISSLCTRFTKDNAVAQASRSSRLKKLVASKLTKQRRYLGFTQAALAEKIGVDVETISRFERAKHLPPLRTLDRLAKHLKLSLPELLDGLDGIDATATTDIQRLGKVIETLSVADRQFVMTHAEQLAAYLAKASR